VSGQAVSSRGFVEARVSIFPQRAPNDTERVVADVLGREELFAVVSPWLQLAAGVDVRANTHDQVTTTWTPDIGDRGALRPALSIRRLSATVVRGPLTLDIGKQFVRWGKADILTPVDRFAPRDFLNVIDSEFLAVRGVRAVLQREGDTLDLVWVPFFTPSRLPLPDQRWAVLPTSATFPPDGGVPIASEAQVPGGSQAGVRWGRIGAGYELALSFFDGFHHLPNLDVALVGPGEATLVTRYPSERMYGGEAAVPMRWFTVKGEAAYFTSSTPSTDEYVLYVIQLERQTGEWLVVGGYAGEHVTAERAALTFAPDRGTARSILGRASYTIDGDRSIAFEGAVRRNARGAYAKGEYSQAYGRRWRATVSGVVIGGREDDFLGQYRRNSSVAAALRYSF
jgi:hypothetical protein